MASQNLLPIKQMTVPVDEIQGDVLVGLQKKAEIFVFFTIQDVTGFRTSLKAAMGHIAFLRTTAAYEIAKPGTPEKAKVVKANIAFSHPGLKKLGLGDTAGVDASFVAGAKASAPALGDKVTDWLPAYASETFDGVLLVAAWDKSPSHALTLARAEVTKIELTFGNSILEAHREENKVRESVIGGKAQSGHEHFGFADGVSQPGVLGMTKPGAEPDKGNPGQDLVKPGEFVIGLVAEEPAPAPPPPAWMANGSYMVIRRLRQDVTGFYSWAAQAASSVAKSEDEFTAGLIGRWKDGTPFVRNPAGPNPAEDESHPEKNNDFDFGTHDADQAKCPFQAHIRRVYPRSDIGDASEKHRILRAGIAFGDDEDHDKGLFFVCYQNSIQAKFEFIQSKWANNAGFPNPVAEQGMKVPPQTGIDLIIGQGGEVRDGVWHTGKVAPPQPQQFVTSTGAAYFFSPSRTTLAMIGNG